MIRIKENNIGKIGSKKDEEYIVRSGEIILCM